MSIRCTENNDSEQVLGAGSNATVYSGRHENILDETDTLAYKHKKYSQAIQEESVNSVSANKLELHRLQDETEVGKHTIHSQESQDVSNNFLSTCFQVFQEQPQHTVELKQNILDETDTLASKHKKYSQAIQEESINSASANKLEEMQQLLLKNKEDLLSAKVAQETLLNEMLFLKSQVVGEQQERATMKENWSREISQLREDLDRQKEASIDEERAQLQQSQEEKIKLEGEIQQLKNKVTSLQVDLNYRETVQRDFANRFQSLQQIQLEKIRALETEMKELAESLETEKASRTDLEMYVAVLSTQKDVLQSDTDRLRAQITEVCELLEQEKLEHVDQKRTWQIAKDQFMESQRLMVMDIRRVESVLTELKKEDTERGQMERRVRELEELREKEEKEQEQRRKVIDRQKEASIDEERAQLQQSQEEKMKQEGEIQWLKNKVTSLQVELDNCEVVQRDLVKLSQSLQIKLEGEIQQLKNKVTSLQVDLNYSETVQRDFANRFQSLQQEVKALRPRTSIRSALKFNPVNAANLDLRTAADNIRSAAPANIRSFLEYNPSNARNVDLTNE